jgi:hypothetical protein
MITTSPNQITMHKWMIPEMITLVERIYLANPLNLLIVSNICAVVLWDRWIWVFWCSKWV